MTKNQESFESVYNSLNNEGLKNEIDLFLDDTSNYMFDNEENNKINVLLEGPNISIEKYNDSLIENLIVYNDLYSYYRSLEQLEDSFIYTILQKKYNPLGELDVQIRQDYVLTEDSLRRLFIIYRTNNKNLYNLFYFLREKEQARDLKDYAENYSEVTENSITNTIKELEFKGKRLVKNNSRLRN